MNDIASSPKWHPSAKFRNVISIITFAEVPESASNLITGTVAVIIFLQETTNVKISITFPNSKQACFTSSIF